MKSLARELFAIDLRSLATFRIAIGIVLLIDLGVRATDLGAMYTDDGMFPRAVICRHFSGWNWSFHFGSGSWWYQAALFGAAAVFSLALLVGFETRLATAASWLLLVSLQNRVPHILSGADNLVRMLLFWGMFLPLGRAVSADARLAKRRGIAEAYAEAGSAATSATFATSATSVASAASLLQMAFMYVFSAVFKSNADWLQGKAIAGILPDAFYGKPIAAWLLQFPTVLAVLTVGVLALEWIGPFLLFLPVRTARVRLWIVGLLASMHVGIALLLNVGLFSIASLAGLILFLPSSFWEKLRARFGSATVAPERVEAVEGSSPEAAPSLVTFAAQGTCALALAFVVFANINGLPSRFLPWTPLPKVEFLTVSCGLGQKWDMFAEAPPRNGWWVARATLADGTEVDLLRGGAPVTWERPEDPAAAYPNHRWRKCFREMSYTDERGYQMFRRPVAEYLCREWSRGRVPEKRVSEFALVFCTQDEGEYTAGLAPPTLREAMVRLDLAAGEGTSADGER